MPRHHTRRLISLFASVLALTLLSAACADDSSSPDGAAAPESEDPVADGPAPLAVTATVESVEQSPIAALVSVEASRPVTVQITATSPTHDVATPVTAATAESHSLPLVGLRQDSTYDVTITVTDPSDAASTTTSERFTTGTLDLALADFAFSADTSRAAPGITMLELNPAAAVNDNVGNPIIGLDNDGEIVWFYQRDGFTGALRQSAAGTIYSQNFPFGMSEIDVLGNTITSYFGDNEGTATTTRDGDTTAIPYHADWVDLDAIHHDVFPMDDGTILFLSATTHEVTQAQRDAIQCPDDDAAWSVLSDVIVHIDADGTVLRTWDTWDIVDFDALPGHFLCDTDGLMTSETVRDWTHVNAAVYDAGRDAVIISSRHTDQIIALEMTDDLGPQTGVRWILGSQGTIPYEGESFHHTHGVDVTADGSLIAYDNGNFRPGTTPAGGDTAPYSRAVRIAVDDAGADPADWRATQVWDSVTTDVITGEPIFSPFLSDADVLANGNVLITHGGITGDGFTHVRIVEVVPAGESGGGIVWDFAIGGPDDPYTMYRSDRWETLYAGPLWES